MMSKVNPRKDTTIDEMEELMSQPDADEGQFAAYLQRKLAEKQRPMNNDLLFGNVSFDFDFDVDLIKKPMPTGSSVVNPVVATGEAKEPPAPPPAAESDLPTSLPAATTSPNLSPSRIRGSSRNVPGSDKLRRRAIRRLSQSCGRQLIKEFEAINVTRSPFKPAGSSTPCSGQSPTDIQVKEIDNNPKMTLSENPETEKAAEKPAEKSQVQTEPKKCITALDSETIDMAAEASLMYRQRLSSFQSNILQLDYTGKAPSSDGVGCTYTIEKGPAPGQLLLSPSRRSPICTAADKRLKPIVKVRRHKDKVMVPDTPPPANSSRSEPDPEFVVPDTQFQDLGQLVQNLSRNASGPIVVINTANSKPNAEMAHVQPVPVEASAPSALTPIYRSSTEGPCASSQLAAPNYNSSPAGVAASPAKTQAPGDSPKSSRKSLLVNNVDAIMTDDESDEQPSTVAMNLAQRVGDKRRQRSLRNQNNPAPTPALNKENNFQLLNLHQSINAKKSKQVAKPATVPLNKAPCAPINGEQFAQELARMSNYEILDLRKRNSLGKMYLVNGHKKSSTVQQVDLERSIQRELMRRNLIINGNQLTSSPANDEFPEREPLHDTFIHSKNRSPREFKESDDDPASTPLQNFTDTKKRTEPSRSSRRQHLKTSQKSEDYETLPPPVPRNFEDSPRRPERSKRSNRCYSRIMSEESSDEDVEPPVPCNFQDSRKEAQHSLVSNPQSRRMSKKSEDDGLKDKTSPRSALRSLQESSNENKTAQAPYNIQESRKPAQHSLPPNRQSQEMSKKSEADTSWMPPVPNAFKDKRCSRSRLRSSQESKELSSYLKLSKTMEMRRMTRKSTKRKLYTKGDSTTESFDDDDEPYKKQKSYTHSEVNSEGDNIAIVPPPPNSLRYSQSLRDFRTMKQIDLENAEIGAKENTPFEIAPPPPETIEPSWVNPSLRQESNENDICPPHTESDGTMEQALPAPTEFCEPESDETETAQGNTPVNERKLPSPKNGVAISSQKRELQCVSSSQDKSISGPDIVADNEQPSTSLAARKARESRTQKDKAQSKLDDEIVFKKPLMPAPRVKSQHKSKELDKLMQSVIYGQTSMDDGSTCSGGVRRSKRGHVPIKNTWCHTQDIWDMPFMRAELPMQRPKNKPTLKSIEKKKSTAATKKIINPLSDRGPVCSSTPRNPDIIVEPFPDSAFLGQHSAISSKEPFAETDAESHHNFESVTSEGQTNRNNESNRVRNWLLGVSNVQPSERSNQGKGASFLEDMRFSELDGIEYAFHDTKDPAAVGYMRFKPHQVRNKKKVKACPLKFIVQIGEFAVQYGPIDGEEEESCILHEGDMVEVDKGSRYSIQNILDAVGVLLVIRG